MKKAEKRKAGKWSVFLVGVEYAKEIRIYDAVKFLLAKKNGGLVAFGETDIAIRSGWVRYRCVNDENGECIGHEVDLTVKSGKPIFVPRKEKKQKKIKVGTKMKAFSAMIGLFVLIVLSCSQAMPAENIPAEKTCDLRIVAGFICTPTQCVAIKKILRIEADGRKTDLIRSRNYANVEIDYPFDCVLSVLTGYNGR